MAERDRVYGVTELAAEFDLTPQALRFYEEKGLLAPQRAGGRRVFTYRDRARLKLILKFRRIPCPLPLRPAQRRAVPRRPAEDPRPPDRA